VIKTDFRILDIIFFSCILVISPSLKPSVDVLCPSSAFIYTWYREIIQKAEQMELSELWLHDTVMTQQNATIIHVRMMTSCRLVSECSTLRYTLSVFT